MCRWGVELSSAGVWVWGLYSGLGRYSVVKTSLETDALVQDKALGTSIVVLSRGLA